MATALDMIKRSMRLVGALGGGETPTDDEAVDGLAALNSMLDQWWIQRLAVYSVDEYSASWASGQASRTIGSGGDFNTTRPVKVQSARQTISDIDYPIAMVTSEQYRAIPDKTTQSTLITHIWYDPTVTTGTLYAYPVPSSAATVKLHVWQQVESFATKTETIALPPGYRQAIEFNLAVLLAPEYERAVPDAVGSQAVASLRLLKRLNVELPTMTVEPAYMVGSMAGFNWRTGY